MDQVVDRGVEEVIKHWPKEPQASARRLIEYYGPPDEYSASQLMWRNTKDGWKRTVLVREEVQHDFPAPHTDFLEQTIDYKVPLELYSTLAE